MRNVSKILVAKRGGKRPLLRYRHRRDNNIKMDVKEIGCEGANWIQLALDYLSASQERLCSMELGRNRRFHGIIVRISLISTLHFLTKVFS
jgi:hypothetical protein